MFFKNNFEKRSKLVEILFTNLEMKTQ